MKNLWYFADLQLFAGEGAEGVAAETGDEVADAGQNNAEVDYDKEFGELISGRFKEQFTKKTQEIIDKRFKETKELESYKAKVSPVISALMERHGIARGNEEMLLEALDGDSVEKQHPDENSQRENQLKSRIGGWLKESRALQKTYPDFDLRNELKANPLFAKLVLSGAPLEAAYETVHHKEILSGAMAYTAGKVREQVVKGIEAKGRRPVENGVTAEGAVVTSVDVNSLTSQDILKILKQVENGANISF